MSFTFGAFATFGEETTAPAVEQAPPAETAAAEPAKAEEKDLTELSLEELMNVKVETSSKQVQSLRDAPSIMTVMQRKDIEKMGVTSLIDVLKFVPGIETSMDPIGDWRVAIRGSRKDGNILVLIDGHAINDFYDGKAIYELPTHMIEKVEVIRGPGSPLYGTNAVAGIINVFTVKKTKNAKLAVGTDTLFSADANYTKDTEAGVPYSLSAGYLQTDGANVIATSEEGYSKAKTNRFQKDFYLSGSYEKPEWKANFVALRKNNGPWVGPELTVAPDSSYVNTHILASAEMTRNLTDNISYTPKIYANLINRDSLIEERTDGYQSGGFPEGKMSREKYLGLTTGLELQAKIKFTDDWSYLNGLVAERSTLQDYELTHNYLVNGTVYRGDFANHDGTTFYQKGKYRDILAYFGQLDYTASKVNVSTGFRYDKYSDFGESFNPRVGAIYKYSDRLSFKALYGQAFRAPTFKELYDQANTSVYGVLGNERLNPETSKSADLGAEFQFANVILRGNVYQNATTNLLAIYDPQGSGGSGYFQNMGNLKNLGFEVEANVLLTQQLTLLFNFSQFTLEFEWNPAIVSQTELTYIESKGDKYVTNAPATRANLGLDYTRGKWRTFYGVNFGGKSEANKRFPLEGTRETKIATYLHHNFRVAYDYNSTTFIQLAGTNIGDPKYSDPEESTNIYRLGNKGMGQPGTTYVLSVHNTY